MKKGTAILWGKKKASDETQLQVGHTIPTYDMEIRYGYKIRKLEEVPVIWQCGNGQVSLSDRLPGFSEDRWLVVIRHCSSFLLLLGQLSESAFGLCRLPTFSCCCCCILRFLAWLASLATSVLQNLFFFLFNFEQAASAIFLLLCNFVVQRFVFFFWLWIFVVFLLVGGGGGVGKSWPPLRVLRDRTCPGSPASDRGLLWRVRVAVAAAAIAAVESSLGSLRKREGLERRSGGEAVKTRRRRSVGSWSGSGRAFAIRGVGPFCTGAWRWRCCLWRWLQLSASFITSPPFLLCLQSTKGKRCVIPREPSAVTYLFLVVSLLCSF